MIVFLRKWSFTRRINEKGFIEEDFINRLRFNLFDMLKDGENFHMLEQFLIVNALFVIEKNRS